MEIVGHKIVAIRFLTASEIETEGWEDRPKPLALVLDNGIVLYASRDDEGNGPGAMFGRNKGEAFTLIDPTEEPTP